MMFRYMNVAVCLWLVAETVVAQLPPRPKDGQEQAISDEQQAEVERLLEDYSANYRKLDRYACAVWLDHTFETYGEGVAFNEYWVMHARNNQLPMRRLDHIRQIPGTNPRYNNGLPTLTTFRLTTFESPKVVCQVHESLVICGISGAAYLAFNAPDPFCSFASLRIAPSTVVPADCGLLPPA